MVYKLIKSGQVVSLTDRQYELLSKREQDKFFVSNDGVAKDNLPQAIKEAKDKITLTEKESIEPPIVTKATKAINDKIDSNTVTKIIPSIENIIAPPKEVQPQVNTNEIDSLFK